MTNVSGGNESRTARSWGRINHYAIDWMDQSWGWIRGKWFPVADCKLRDLHTHPARTKQEQNLPAKSAQIPLVPSLHLLHHPHLPQAHRIQTTSNHLSSECCARMSQTTWKGWLDKKVVLVVKVMTKNKKILENSLVAGAQSEGEFGQYTQNHYAMHWIIDICKS